MRVAIISRRPRQSGSTLPQSKVLAQNALHWRQGIYAQIEWCDADRVSICRSLGQLAAHLGLTLMRGMVSTTVLLSPGRPEVVMVRAEAGAPPPASGKFVEACGPRIARAAASYARAASSSYSKKPRWFTWRGALLISGAQHSGLLVWLHSEQILIHAFAAVRNAVSEAGLSRLAH